MRTNGFVSLELLNAGALTRNDGGTGLASLADRVATVNGSTSAAPVEGGRFRLHVEVPSR